MKRQISYLNKIIAYYLKERNIREFNKLKDKSPWRQIEVSPSFIDQKIC